MNTTKPTLWIALATTALLATTQTGSAQRFSAPPPSTSGTILVPKTHVRRSGVHSMNIGNAWLGGSVAASGTFWADRYSTGADAGGYVDMSAYGNLLEIRRRLFDMHGSANTGAFGSNSYGHASLSLVVAGKTILNRNYVGTSLTRRFSAATKVNAFGLATFVNVWVKGLPVTVGGNISVDVDVALDATLLPGGHARWSGRTTAEAVATMSGSAGEPGLGFAASVQVEGEIFKNGMAPNATADARLSNVSVRGSLPYAQDPISLSLEACVTTPVLGQICTTLASWRFGSVTIADLLAL